MCQDRCQTTCQNWCSNTCHMFVIIFVRWFSLFFPPHKVYCTWLHTDWVDIIPMIVNDKHRRTFPVCVGECALATTAQVPISTVPVRATREGPPQAAQVGEWDGPSFWNPAPPGELLWKWQTFSRHQCNWFDSHLDNPGDSSWRTLDCTVPMLNQEVQMSRKWAFMLTCFKFEASRTQKSLKTQWHQEGCHCSRIS